MVFLYILCGLVALIALLLCLPIRLRLRSDEEGAATIRLQLGWFSLFRHPERQHRLRMRRYSRRAIAAREKKQARDALRASRKAAKRKKSSVAAHKKAAAKKTLSEKVSALTDTLSLVTSLLDALHEKFFRSLHIHLHAFTIRVGSNDAARTALLFGALCPVATALLQSVEQFTNLHVHHPDRICVLPDFERNTLRTHIDLCVQLRLVHLLPLSLTAIGHLLRHKTRSHQLPAPQPLADRPAPR